MNFTYSLHSASGRIIPVNSIAEATEYVENAHITLRENECKDTYAGYFLHISKKTEDGRTLSVVYAVECAENETDSTPPAVMTLFDIREEEE